MFYGHREEKPYPLNSVMETNELLCQGYVVYRCYAIDIHSKEEKEEDIPIICEFIDVFLKNYQECSAKRN